MVITHRITRDNQVVLQNVKFDDNEGVGAYLAKLSVTHGFLEYPDGYGELVDREILVRWVMFEPLGKGNYLFADGQKFAEILRAEDKTNPEWLPPILETYFNDVQNGDGPARAVDYKTGCMIYAACKWLILVASRRWEAGDVSGGTLNFNLSWLPVIQSVLDTLADRYREEDPDLKERLHSYMCYPLNPPVPDLPVKTRFSNVMIRLETAGDYHRMLYPFRGS